MSINKIITLLETSEIFLGLWGDPEETDNSKGIMKECHGKIQDLEEETVWWSSREMMVKETLSDKLFPLNSFLDKEVGKAREEHHHSQTFLLFLSWWLPDRLLEM